MKLITTKGIKQSRGKVMDV